MISFSKHVLAALAAAVLVLSASVSPAAAISTSGYEKQIMKRTNYHRDKADKVKVKKQACVDRWAERQAAWMAKHGKLQHQNLSKVLKDCKLTGVSENIAYGYSSGNRTVNAWMKSSGHKKNILASKMRYIGAAAVKDDDDRWWAVEVFGTKK